LKEHLNELAIAIQPYSNLLDPGHILINISPFFI